MTEEVVINPADSEVIGFTPLGEVFCSARNAKKLALKDVSNNLRLSVKQIEALENNDFSSLPPAMITRGFIRNYARLLELDAEPLLASYRIRIPDSTPNTLSVKTSMNRVMSSKSSASSLKYVLLSGLVLILVVAWFYYANYMQKSVKPTAENMAVTSASEPVTEVLSLPEVALPAAERQPQAEVVDVQTAVNADTENAADATQALPGAVGMPPKVEATSKPTVNSPAINNPDVVTQNLQLPKETTVDYNKLKEKTVQKGTLPNVAGSSDEKAKVPDLAKSGLKTDSSIAAIKGVNLAVTEQTWVRVTDKSGAVVYEKMLKANTQDGFNGLPPFKMLIGNAKATKLTFLGQDVDLTGKTRNNVARLTLE